MVYRVSKVLNNNTVISRDEDNNEIIVTGNGIGYGKHPGMMIDEKDVRNVYVSKSKAFIRRFAKMVNEIPDICFLEAEKIRDLAQKELNKEMSDNIVLALADHINFVVAQYRNDDTRAMLLNTEFQKIYSQEYEVALKAVKMIEEDFGIHVSEGEASAITFHLVNSEIGNSSNDAVLIANSVEDILKIVKESPLLKYTREGEYVYFVHSYYLQAENKSDVAATTEYGTLIHAAVESGNIYATQFHPEKSGDVGLRILKNFAEI